MRIVILNGSPRSENTSAMVEAFSEGARSKGHEVNVIHVGKMNIAGCLGCEYCHGEGEGKCIQKDDMEKVLPLYAECDMVVIASPIYYFGMTAQLYAAIQRTYSAGDAIKLTKAALLLSSASPDPFDGAISTYKGILSFTGVEDTGIITAAGDENKSEKKLKEIRDFAAGL